MPDYLSKYRQNKDGFLDCADFIQFHPGISATAKAEVLNAIVQDLINAKPTEGMQS